MSSRSDIIRIDVDPQFSRQLQRDNYLEWGRYLERWSWEWLCALPVREGIDYFRAHQIFRVWRLRLAHEEDIQLGLYIITRTKMRVLHMHLLALGRNRKGKTLRDVSAEKWKACWMFPIKAKIREVYDLAGAVDYFARNLLGFWGYLAPIDSLNRRLLAETMEVRNDGLDGLDGLAYRRNGLGSHVC